MRLLLDTHALLWWQGDDERLGPASRALIADPGNDVLVSVASLWEIVVKIRVGKLEADMAAIERAVVRDRFTRLDLATNHFIVLGTLPSHHRDPFDHLLIAQAISEHALFVSADENAAKYPVQVQICCH